MDQIEELESSLMKVQNAISHKNRPIRKHLTPLPDTEDNWKENIKPELNEQHPYSSKYDHLIE